MRVTAHDGTFLTSAGEGRNPVGQTSILCDPCVGHFPV